MQTPPRPLEASPPFGGVTGFGWVFATCGRTQNRIMMDKVDIRWTVTVDVHHTDNGTVVSFVATRPVESPRARA
jgi:hypothetical protein